MEPLVFTERPSYDDEEWSPTAIASDRRYRWRRSDGRTFILSIINNDLCPSPNPLGSVRVGPGSTEVTCVKWYWGDFQVCTPRRLQPEGWPEGGRSLGGPHEEDHRCRSERLTCWIVNFKSSSRHLSVCNDINKYSSRTKHYLVRVFLTEFSHLEPLNGILLTLRLTRTFTNLYKIPVSQKCLTRLSLDNPTRTDWERRVCPSW